MRNILQLKQTLFLQIVGLVAFIEQNENDKGTRPKICKKSVLLYYQFPMEDSSESLEIFYIT